TLGDEDNSLGVPTGSELRAATGPGYGRIWDADIVDALVERFGDGVSGHWRVPGEFGNRITVTKENTTLFASDRDMFVFLADEDRRIEVPGRRNGSGSMARGFFVWNSETGDKTLGLGFFLFDYVCANRIVWGADQYTEVRIRHTKGAPDRWLEEVAPVLKEYDEGSAQPVMQAIEAAREKRVQDDLDAFLAKRFGQRMVEPIKAIHLVEEERPIETLWDVTVAATAHARSIPNNDKRLEIERAAGELLKHAARKHPIGDFTCTPTGHAPAGIEASRHSASMETPDMSDFQIADQGSIISIRPLNEAACQWLQENVVSEPWQWVQGALCVEAR